MLKFFLAYGFNPKGQELAERIRYLIRNLGAEIVDGRLFTGELTAQLQGKIRDCDALISILIEGQDNSYIESETNFALGCNKPIIITAQGDVSRKGLCSGHPYIQLSKEGFDVASELVAAVIKIKKDEDALNESVGIERVHDLLTDDKLKEHLAGSKDIKVLKTWFPESIRIAEGLEEAIRKGATVQLLLCKPGSDILNKRSLGARKPESYGSTLVYNAVYLICNCLSDRSNPKVRIAIYHSWPGCPVIWYDDKILMGFYFRGKSSPAWPWVKVKAGSRLAEILESQFGDLWEDGNTIHLDTIPEMKDWLEKNKEWEMPGVIPEKSTE